MTSILQDPRKYPVEDIVISRVLESKAEGLDLRWRRIYDDELLGYNIYRSLVQNPQEPELDWVKINQEIVGTNFFRDVNTEERLLTVYWYKVVWVNSHNVESDLDFATSFTFQFKAKGFIRPVIQEIKRRHSWIMKQDGFFESVDIFIKKHAGVRCSCYDKELGRSTKGQSCPECLGTGIVGAYYLLRNQTARIRSRRQVVIETKTGLKINTAPTVLLPPFPPVFREDLIETKDGILYMIGDVQSRQVQGEVTIQVAEVGQLPPNHFLYRNLRRTS